MSPSEFLTFVAPGNYGEKVSHFRLIRDCIKNRYIVLMRFRRSKDAHEFFNEYNGRLFSSLGSELCQVVFVHSFEFKSASIPPYAFSDDVTNLASKIPPLLSQSSHTLTSVKSVAPALYELPTCPVCLERMDASVTGLLTILCQHTFHCSCLSRWGDNRFYKQ